MCIQNNDPEMRGRIKVFIPLLSPSITKDGKGIPLSQDPDSTDKFFNFIGKETNAELTKTLKDLKELLPWAEYAGPICGGNASGRYQAKNELGHTSDSNAWISDTTIPTKGIRPIQNYITETSYPDAFTTTGEHKNRFTNMYSYQYTPTNYSGLARGLFSIPNVGAHVYVFFLNGDYNFPIYFAASYSQEDIKRIFTLSDDMTLSGCMDYPASYENKPKLDKLIKDFDQKTFRSKTVLNSNKHTIELIDTDLHEIVKINHFSGSFKEFNNFATIELATGNDQQMVIGDQFKTVQRNKSEYIKGHSELITGGDLYINVGETSQKIVQQILNHHKAIHEYKMLFDIQRVDATVGSTGNPKDLSVYQKKSGTHIKCPICNARPYNPYDSTYTTDPLTLWKEAPYWTGGCFKYQDHFFSPTCHTYKNDPAITNDINKESCTHLEHPLYMKNNTILPQTQRIGKYRGATCATCKGSGLSPSSENGQFALEPHKQPDKTLDQTILKLTPAIFKLEKQLGEGDVIQNIAKNKIETIGLAMNDMKSYRVDPIGKLKIEKCWVAPQGTYPSYAPVPHVEYVDVADIPGGDYILTVMNKYKLLVGARGINIQTFGPLDIYGTIVNFTGEQVNISSKNEVLIDGGEKLSILGRDIAIMPYDHKPVVIDGQLHVTRNTILKGGLMVEGELGLLHVTAPLEWQETAPAVYDTNPTCVFEKSMILGSLDGCCSQIYRIVLPNHTHYFKNIPVLDSLLKHPEAVRESMITQGINLIPAMSALPVKVPPEPTITAAPSSEPCVAQSCGGCNCSTLPNTYTVYLENIFNIGTYYPWNNFSGPYILTKGIGCVWQYGEYSNYYVYWNITLSWQEVDKEWQIAVLSQYTGLSYITYFKLPSQCADTTPANGIYVHILPDIANPNATASVTV